ncbi:Fis family transcriptional regulator [Frankia sp. B2]|nr:MULTISPECIES: helix-turn-helix domain-containing protein [Frankia]KDA41484.1 transcriptional activator of acetoin/glycerol metabolism [Frankia sp. BMG5.23]TFE24599.1 Fis family transcriptional regulator [Frankia sp. B2]ESZ99876.1 transcriptional activator of acetoin/glycerol metabolism [Frankia sp. CcI6]KFB03066.1 transcriptional activator of acetoin/glycerol metabolism [Frankia sp. Allo2]OAA18473.1 transcriptional activator of acetoin/glycerol metabolism [Frankia casuarinae]
MAGCSSNLDAYNHQGAEVAQARELFLTTDSIEPDRVRDSIRASWLRSRHWEVAAEGPRLTFVGDLDSENPVSRAAAPIVRQLGDQLVDQPISIILTDAEGVVLARRTGDRALEKHLDAVQLAPGFSYAERLVGTNGIGTALEGRSPAHVFGHEHYASNLENLACAGVPMHHPVTRKIIGVLDLTCWRPDAGPLLMAMARAAAAQIQESLLANEEHRDLALLREYLRTCQRISGVVLGLNDDVVMMNEHARQLLDPRDQSVLIGRITDVVARRRATTLMMELPSGTWARVHCRTVATERATDGAVAHVRFVEAPRPRHADTALTRLPLPGIVGSGTLWTRACREVDAAAQAGEWVILRGEPGVGKTALARAVCQRHDPSAWFSVVDGHNTTVREWGTLLRHELSRSRGTLVVRHVDRIDPYRLHVLASACQAAEAGGRRDLPWVVLTLSADDKPLGPLMRYFPRCIEVPPLRHHIDDLHQIVPFLLVKLTRGGQLACSPQAMQALLRTSWPGNIEQVRQVLRKVIQVRPAGTIMVGDLPPECHTVTRRVLGAMEAIERDAIVQSLLSADGNRTLAARALGMSRATIYRRIRQYGIEIPAPSV